MVGYLLLIFLAIGMWVLFGYGVKQDLQVITAVGLILATLCTTFSITFGVVLANKSSEVAIIQKDRDFYQELISGLLNNASFATISRIVSNAESINSKILTHRKHYNSKWIGIWYSKDVAELKLIEIPKYNFSVEIKE
jgi:hypothetical protein